MSADKAFQGTLDSADWAQTRQQAHRMLDDMLDHIQNIRGQPVWQLMPQETRDAFRAPLPREPQPIDAIHDQFLTSILPYGSGNL
ncbi:MAG TPA: hypothetical protein VGG66_07900, partial [Rhizomicrobium sp.]